MRAAAIPPVGLAVGLAATLAVAAPSATAGTRDEPGAPGVGDGYFPRAGNGGYGVRHYLLDLTYHPRARHLEGVATIRATATDDLSTFDLDLHGFEISRLTVDGRPAGFRRDGQELVISPRPRLADGETFIVRVRYSGRTGRPVDVTGSLYGWVSMPDGALVANEPDGAPTWYPVNDHPTDKATYDFRVTVPAGKTAVANGDLSVLADPRGVDDVGVARRRSDGELPVHGIDRRLSAARVHHP
ncbi:MAG: hypothetical protein ACRDPT_12480 [Streptomycetales bacterium]